jgi:transposase
MRVARPIQLNEEQRKALEQCARSRSRPARTVERSRIVLLAAAGKQDAEIAEQVGITPKKVARWRARFLADGLSALEKDAPRGGRPPSITADVVQEVIRKTT